MAELLGVHPAIDGYELVAMRRFDPHLVRDTFSGGVNVTRRALNLRRIDESLKLYPMQAPHCIVGSRFAIAALKAACGKEVTCPAKAHPAAIEWYASLHRRLGSG